MRLGQALTLRNGREMCCASAIKHRSYAINLAYNLANGFDLTSVNSSNSQLVATLVVVVAAVVVASSSLSASLAWRGST